MTWMIAVYALAVARVTRLITADTLTEPIRERLVTWTWKRRYGKALTTVVNASGEQLPAWRFARANGAEEPKLAYLLQCAWCASIYVSLPAAAICWYWPTEPWFAIPAVLLALSYVTGFLASKEG